MSQPTARFREVNCAGAALASYLLLTIGLTFPLATHFASAIPGDSFDGWQNYWNLWWIKLALLEKVSSPWFTDLLYHPTGVSLLFHTLNPFNGFTFLPVQLAFGLIPEYNSAVVFSFAVGGLGSYLLARQVLGRGTHPLAAALAGAVFTFSPYHFAHLLGHLQLIALVWIPYFALYLLRAVQMVENRRLRSAAVSAGMAVLFLVLVAMCDWYYVFYCLIMSAVVVAWAGVRALRLPRRRSLLGVALAVAAIWLAAASVLAPILAPMVREARQSTYMVPDPEQSRTLSSDLLAFVTPQGFHPLWGDWARALGERFTSTISEYTVFAGFTVLALTVFGLRTRRGRSQAGLWMAVALTFFVLSLGPVLHFGGRIVHWPAGGELSLPYEAVADLPFISIMRSVSRLDVILMLALGILAGRGLDRLLAGRARLVGAAAIVLVLFEFLPAPFPMSEPDTPDWYRSLARDGRPGAVLNLPVNWDRPGYLLYQTVHEKPLTVAYISRNDPRTLTERAPVLQHFRHLGPDIIDFDLADQGQQVLADLDVRWVVLDRYKMPGGAEREYTDATAATIFQGQKPAYEDERLTVYEVSDREEVQPYIMLGDGWGPFDAATQSRSFAGHATLTIVAPQPQSATLYVRLAPGNMASIGPITGNEIRVILDLRAGRNEVSLGSAQPSGAQVQHIAVLP